MCAFLSRYKIQLELLKNLRTKQPLGTWQEEVIVPVKNIDIWHFNEETKCYKMHGMWQIFLLGKLKQDNQLSLYFKKTINLLLDTCSKFDSKKEESWNFGECTYMHILALKNQPEWPHIEDSTRDFLLNCSGEYLDLVKGDSEKALECFNACLQCEGLGEQKLAKRYLAIASCHGSLANYADAKKFHKKALKIRNRLLKQALKKDNLLKSKLKSTYPNSNLLTSETKELIADVAESYNCLGINLRELSNLNCLDKHIKGLELRECIFPTNSPEIAESLNSLSLTMYFLNKYHEAKTYIDQAVKIREICLGKNHFLTIESYSNQGLILHALGLYQDSLDAKLNALTAWEDKYEELHPTIATAHSNVGIGYADIGNYKKAFEHVQKAVDIWICIRGEQHEETAKCFSNLGYIFYLLEQFDKAYEFRKKALDIYINYYPNSHLRALAHLNFANALDALEKHQEAFTEKENGLKASDLNLENETCTQLLMSQALSLIYLDIKSKDIQLIIERGLAIFKRIYPSNPNHYHISKCYSLISFYNFRMNKFEEAKKHQELALTARTASNGEFSVAAANSYQLLGIIFFTQNKFGEAIENFSKAAVMREQKIGIDHPSTGLSYYFLGLCYEGTDLTKMESYKNKAKECGKNFTADDIEKAKRCWHSL